MEPSFLNRAEYAQIQRSALLRPRWSETKCLHDPEWKRFSFRQCLHRGFDLKYCCEATESRPKNQQSCYPSPYIPHPCERVPKVGLQMAEVKPGLHSN